MRVTTQFVHPLVEEDPASQCPSTMGGTNPTELFLPESHNLEELSLDELFGQIGGDELTWAGY